MCVLRKCSYNFEDTKSQDDAKTLQSICSSSIFHIMQYHSMNERWSRINCRTKTMVVRALILQKHTWKLYALHSKCAAHIFWLDALKRTNEKHGRIKQRDTCRSSCIMSSICSTSKGSKRQMATDFYPCNNKCKSIRLMKVSKLLRDLERIERLQ